MLALASELSTLETDPSALGKRFQLTATLPPSEAPRVARIPGVQAAAPRYGLEAADAFALGETINVIAFAGDHTTFEAPPLVSGRRLRGPRETEVGQGLAQALGLTEGSMLALALPSGGELRLRVVGIVSSLQHDGRVAYVPASGAAARGPGRAVADRGAADPDGGSGARVSATLSALGGEPTVATGATARGAPLVDVLRTILRAVAIVDGLVCLYALIQACALTAHERRRTLAVLRACGAGPGAVRRLLVGAVLAIIIPAALIGIVLERFVFGPALSRLAANYATLPLNATLLDVLADARRPRRRRGGGGRLGRPAVGLRSGGQGARGVSRRATHHPAPRTERSACRHPQRERARRRRSPAAADPPPRRQPVRIDAALPVDRPDRRRSAARRTR